MTYSRRSFIRNTAIATAGIPFIDVNAQACDLLKHKIDDLDVSIFSKHLQFLDYKEAGQIAAELGFNGVDLTVRPKGHVLPEKVSSDLPVAIQDINAGGSKCKMITTSIESVSNPDDVDIIKTAAETGVSFYRTHWFKYQEEKTMTDSLESYQEEVRKLALLNKEHGIIGCYQNHAGKSIGASYWEIHKLLETAEPQFFGTQYDIRTELKLLC